MLLNLLPQNGSVPLEIAAANGHFQTVQRLLEESSNINQQNKVPTMFKLTGKQTYIGEYTE